MPSMPWLRCQQITRVVTVAGLGTVLLAACASTPRPDRPQVSTGDNRLFIRTYKYCQTTGADQYPQVPDAGRDPQIMACMADFGWTEAYRNGPWRYEPLSTSRQLPE